MEIAPSLSVTNQVIIMLPRIVARLDIKGNQLCKGIHLEGLKYLGPASTFAKHYYEEKADELLFMDCVASLYQRNSLYEVIEETAKNIFIPLTVGGGIRSIADIQNVLNAGADKVAINTEFLKRPEFLEEAITHFGASTICVSIVTKRNLQGQSTCYINNGRDNTRKDALEWVNEINNAGAGEIILTSIDQEGTGLGYDMDLIKQISEITNIPLIVGGGAGNINHIEEGIKGAQVSGVSLASIIHYDAIKNIPELESTQAQESSFTILNEKKSFDKIEPASILEIKNQLIKQGIICRT